MMNRQYVLQFCCRTDTSGSKFSLPVHTLLLLNPYKAATNPELPFRFQLICSRPADFLFHVSHGCRKH
uniref:Uncharacterized protein n=1 Tax=Anguilla anguilla TaxID=7936 RepID=A0A0E9RT20_ANGAN